ncbi:MAG TPA: patatin-like phospholipase family protein [Polyangiales bacterium]|nr:patatin-like phospholipase family protein [Polyangiales bacterium]
MSTGIVLSGGGARGAYEAGVVAGIMEVLKPKRAPFDVLCGTSVGALNAAYLASHAHVPDMNAPGLISQWQALDLNRHLRFDIRGVLGRKPKSSLLPPMAAGPVELKGPRHIGRSMLQTGAIDELVEHAVLWEQLRENVKQGLVRALIVAALHITTGKTTLFAEMTGGAEYKSTRDPRRTPLVGPISAEHILASAAIPLLFPARRVGSEYYCDGGVRYNTPIAPAIRAGAERLVVISLLSDAPEELDDTPLERRLAAYQSPVFLIGKVLNALLLDPLNYDLQILDRFNRLIATLEHALTPEEMARVNQVLEENRGLAYRKVETLVFRPSKDIGRMARARSKQIKSSMFSSWLLARTATLGAFWESDLLSFILFDKDFAHELIQLGRDDTVARAADIRRFFGV